MSTNNASMLPDMDGAFLINLQQHGDERGFFSEIFKRAWRFGFQNGDDYRSFQDYRLDWPELQLNHSFSVKATLRGLHWHQHQADFWYVVSGMAQVGLVNRDRSRSAGILLQPGRALYIPNRVAHGFLALSDVNLIYAVDRYYNPNEPDEHGIMWDSYDIPWRIDGSFGFERDDLIISDRDKSYS